MPLDKIAITITAGLAFWGVMIFIVAGLAKIGSIVKNKKIELPESWTLAIAILFYGSAIVLSIWFIGEAIVKKLGL